MLIIRTEKSGFNIFDIFNNILWLEFPAKHNKSTAHQAINRLVIVKASKVHKRTYYVLYFLVILYQRFALKLTAKCNEAMV